MYDHEEGGNRHCTCIISTGYVDLNVGCNAVWCVRLLVWVSQRYEGEYPVGDMANILSDYLAPEVEILEK